jgi:CheY-like chemotaxis protein
MHGGIEEQVYSDAPAVLVFADSNAGRAAAAAAVRAAGGRVGAALPIARAVERLDDQASLDAVMLDVSEDHGDLLDRLLDRLDHAARTGRHASVVTLTPALIDIVAARASHGDITLLCTPDPLERTAAIGMAFVRRETRLHDMGAEGGTVRLRQLSEEVGRIARTLAALSGEEVGRGDGAASLGERRQSFNAPGSIGVDAGWIRSIIRGRRLRDQFFCAELFADPAWDMLLDLMAARLERRQVAVSSLCIAAAVPPTTALRWIKTLTDEGLFVRVADPKDGRRIFIELSDEAARGMTAYLSAARRMGPVI